MDTPGTSKLEEQEEKDPDDITSDIDNHSGEEEEKGPTHKKRRTEKQEEQEITDYNVEDTTKKRRFRREESEETENERLITLDMSKYSPNIQSLTDSQLVEIFEIGVAVKQSFTLTVSESSDFVKKELKSQMEPIVKEMGNFQTNMRQDVSIQLIKFTNETTALQNDLVGQVKGVCQKVEPMSKLEDRVTKAIKSSEETVIEQLKEYKTQVNQVTQQMQKPAIKGSIGENTVMSILKTNLPNSFTLTDVSRQSGGGDIHVETPDENHFLIEVKDYTKNAVPKREIDKFIGVVDNSHEVKVGLMFSLKSGIAKKSKKIQVDTHNSKFLIYVPNALDQKEIMVWSVLLADELAGMNVALKDGQAEKLQKLAEKFKENVSEVKKCRDKMRVLKAAMTDLESNMEPMLKVIENARNEINDIMKRSQMQTVPGGSLAQ